MDRRFVRGELLVRFRSGIGQEARAGLLEQFDAEVKDGPPLPGVRLLEIDQATSVREVAAELEDQPGVRYAEPNYLYRIQATPNDPRFGELWGLDNTGQDLNGTSGTPGADIDAAEAWDATTGSSDITVAIVDTGIANGHPDLAPNIRTNPGESGGGKQSNGIDDDANGLIDDWRGWDFYQSDNDPSDLNGHGSHVAGTVGGSGDNGQGVAGVNWQVGLMPLRVCSARGGCPTSDIASAFAYAGAEGAEVVNASLGGRFSYTISDSIAGAPDTLFAAAAGNAGRDMDSPYTSSKSYPCAYGFPNIVCVAATTQSDGVAEFSNYGVRSVDLGAPGTNILSTWPAYKTVYSEDFEDDISSSWTTGGTHNSWGRTDEAAASGSFSLTDSPGAEYVGGTDSFAQTVAPIDLSEEAGCKLHYEVRLDLLGASPPNSSAELWIYGSSNGSSWNPIAGWIGSSGGDFVSLVDDLSLFDGQGTEFYLRFRLDSGFAVTGGGGAHVDDVEVRCRSSSYAGAEFEFLQGTSMATPHVAGAAALAWSLRPSASPSAVKGALLANADPTPSLATKTVSGARLNADIDRLAAPLITETDPDSPADENRPRVSGWIGPGEGLQVELFRNGTCAGTPAATGSAEQFLGAGIPIDVPDNVTTNLTARAAAGGGAEVCSSPFDYVEDSTFPPAFIHWTNAGAGGIGRASLDGSDPDQAFIPAYNPCGVSIDGRSVFWSASFLWSSRDGTSRLLELNRAELDGSVGAAIYGEWTAFEGADAPCGVAVDPSYVYWANSDGNAVGRAKLDGSSPEQSFISGASAPCGVTVDDSHVYWANGGSDTIGRANLDGSSPDQSFIGGAVDPCGVTVDDSHVYWANGGSDTIGRAKLDGSGAEQSFISGASAPCGVAVDRSYVYWANSGANTIGRANHRGSSPDQSFISGAEAPCGVAVDPALKPPPETTINTGPQGLTNDTSPRFGFTSSKPSSSFECRVDGEAFVPCSSPSSYSDLEDGHHTFWVRAGDPGGDFDPTPASREFTTDTFVDGSATANRTQKQRGKKIVVKAKVKAGEDLEAKASGKVKLGKKSYKLKPAAKSVSSGKQKNLKLKPKKSKDAKKIAKALKQGKKAKAKLTVKLTDEAGNKKTTKLSVKLKR